MDKSKVNNKVNIFKSSLHQHNQPLANFWPAWNVLADFEKLNTDTTERDYRTNFTSDGMFDPYEKYWRNITTLVAIGYEEKEAKSRYLSTKSQLSRSTFMYTFVWTWNTFATSISLSWKQKLFEKVMLLHPSRSLPLNQVAQVFLFVDATRKPFILIGHIFCERYGLDNNCHLSHGNAKNTDGTDRSVWRTLLET